MAKSQIDLRGLTLLSSLASLGESGFHESQHCRLGVDITSLVHVVVEHAEMQLAQEVPVAHCD